MGSTKKVLVAFLAAVAAIAAAFCVTSCEKYYLPSLELSQKTILVNKYAQELSLVVNSNVIWSFEIDKAIDWVTVTPSNGQSTATVKIRIEANDSGVERRLTLSLKSDTLQRDLLIVQSADGGLPEN